MFDTYFLNFYYTLLTFIIQVYKSYQSKVLYANNVFTLIHDTMIITWGFDMMHKKEIKLWLKNTHRYLLKPVWLLSILSLIMSLTAIFFAFYSRETIDYAILGNSRSFLISALIISGILLLQIIASALNQHFKVYYLGLSRKALKKKLFQKLIYAKPTEVEPYHSGALMNYLYSDIETVTDGYLDVKPKIIFYLFRFLGAFIFLYLLDPWFAIFFSGFGLLLFIGSRVLAYPIKKRHHTLMDTDSDLRSYVQESLENLVVIKTFEAEKKMMTLLDHYQENHFTAIKRKNNIMVTTSLGMSIFFAVGYGFAIIFGSYRLMEGAITFGTLTALIQLVNHIQSPFSGISHLVPKYYQMMASAERIIKIDQIEQEHLGQKKSIQKFKELTFKDITFSYDEKPIIQNFNLKVQSEQFIQIKGDSGLGKTTLFKLLLGLVDPKKGLIQLIVGSQKIIVSPETRQAFTYVPQGSIILSGTIRENLEFYEKVSDERLAWACEIACIYDDIMNLPLGFDTLLKEKGVGLSEGQLQRLAIARAILKDAPILLLDEITSALDKKTEIRVFENIKSLTNKTCFIISHRELPHDLIDQTIELT